MYFRTHVVGEAGAQKEEEGAAAVVAQDPRERRLFLRPTWDRECWDWTITTAGQGIGGVAERAFGRINLRHYQC